MDALAKLALPLQLLTGVGLFTLGLVLVHAVVTHRRGRALVATGVAAGWSVLYVGAVLTVSLSSRERVLGLNQPKHFCGFYLDCHAMVSVVEVQKAKTLGSGGTQTTARGLYYIVTVKQSSDAKRVRIGIAKPVAVVLDWEGRRYKRSAVGERALAASDSLPPLGRPVEAGHGYTTRLVFDLPAEVGEPRLQVQEGSVLARLSELFLIGDEDSLFHKMTVFRLF